MNLLKGKKAVVTGGSRGIGAAIVKKFAEEGAETAVIYMGNAAMAEAVCEHCRGMYGTKAVSYKCDVSDFSEAKQTVSKIKEDFGTVDILVNNAGITRDKLLGFMKEEDFDAVIDTNLKGAFNMIKHCSGIFIRNRGGCIVNISSVVGLHGNAGQANYAASKAGVIGLTKSVARELAPRGVRCNAVAPGFIDTDMTKAIGDRTEELVRAIPLGRTGSPEEVAEAVAFLACSTYITGQILSVDGGMNI